VRVRQLGSLCPWDHRGKCYMDRKKIQCSSNASQHVPIYLQPFLRYSGISVASEWFSTVWQCLPTLRRRQRTFADTLAALRRLVATRNERPYETIDLTLNFIYIYIYRRTAGERDFVRL